MDQYLKQNDYRSKVFDVIQVGIWTIEIENGKQPRMYADKVMRKLLGIEKEISPQDCYNFWYSHIFSSHVNVVEKGIDKLIAGKQTEITYPWMSLDGSLRYVRCGGERDFSYTDGLRFFGYHHDVTHIVLDEKQNTEKPIISDYILQVLTSVYEAIHLIDFRTQKVIPIKTQNYENWSGMSVPISEYIDIIKKYLSSDLIEFIIQSITKQELLDKNGDEISYFSHDFSIMIDDKNHWFNMFMCMDESNSNNTMIISFRDIDDTKQKQQIASETISELKKLCEIDGLTGVLNRATLEMHIKNHLNEKNENCAFILIDLDNFKKVNDTLGHIEGDVLLMETAEKLKQLCLVNGQVGRLGGDEFVIFIKDLENKTLLKPFAEQIINKLSKTYKLKNEQIKVTASVGIAISDKENCTFSKLYHSADKALYNSKYSGKNTYTFFC